MPSLILLPHETCISYGQSAGLLLNDVMCCCCSAVYPRCLPSAACSRKPAFGFQRARLWPARPLCL